jgi:neutral trehalase
MSKEIQDLEKQKDEMNNIKDWSEKFNTMKEIKEKIINQKEKLNILLTNLNSNEFKKLKKKKDLTLDELFIEFEECKNLEEKVKLYSHIQAMIKDCELELFDE